MKGSSLSWSNVLAIFAMMQRFGLAVNVFSAAGKALTQEVADLKNPIIEGIAYVGSSQCSNIKNVLHLDYKHVDASEPNLDKLTVNFICPELHLSINLGAVANVLPSMPGYDPKSKLVIFMHGFTDNPEKTNYQQVNQAFQSIGHFNILALDASSLIKLLYLRSSTYVRLIGEKLGDVIVAMVNKGLDPKNIHLVGHSLGAHIAGFTSKQFKQRTGRMVGRVTGLDPAGPCFSHVDENLRLKGTDAQFVDAIHTDGSVFGLKDAVAQADYYPNGGEQQPGCLFETCSHSRAVQLFAESITNRYAFPAVRCAGYNEFRKGNCSNVVSLMGLHAVSGTRGLFYLQTNTTKPYGLGRAGMKFVNRDGLVKRIENFIG